MEDASPTGCLFSLLAPLPRAALPNTRAPAPTVPQWWREDQAVCDNGKVASLEGEAGRAGPSVFKTAESFSNVSLAGIFFLLGGTKGMSSCWSNR